LENGVGGGAPAQEHGGCAETAKPTTRTALSINLAAGGSSLIRF